MGQVLHGCATTPKAVLRRIRRKEVTAHGFRSTFRGWAGKATHRAREVIELALAHKVAGATESAYWRGDLFEKRRVLMDDWVAFLSKPPGQGVASRFGQRQTTNEVVAWVKGKLLLNKIGGILTVESRRRAVWPR